MSLSYIKGRDNLDVTERFETIAECLQYQADTKPDGDAVVFCSTVGRRIAVSWKELRDKSYKMARAFVTLGVKPAECIAVVTRTGPEWLYVTFGAMLAGARVTSVVFTYKDGSDFIKLMEQIGNCSLIVLDPGSQASDWVILKGLLDDYTCDGKASSSRIPSLRNLVFIHPPENENVITVNQLVEQDHDASELPETNPNDIAAFFQTSGSTGVPKLVAHSYSSLIYMGSAMRSGGLWSRDEIYLNDRPFTWGGGFPFGVFVGQTRVTVSGFCPEPADYTSFLIDIIRNERCTVAGIFTSMLYDLDQRHKELPSDWPLKTIMTGGHPITKAVAKCIGRICQRIFVCYGATELGFAAGLIVDTPDKVEDFANGEPMAGVEMKIVDKDGAVVPRNERGELYIRSPSNFKEYLNDPEKTAAVKTPDGWYKTDDLARINENGRVYIEGRLSDMIISGAMNVIPAILESVLKSFPGVKSAIVVPVPDDVMYQVVCACVCVDKGFDVTESGLREFMDTVHNDKRKMFTVLPKHYLILDAFPEEGNGKISRKTLKLLAEQKFKK